MVQEEKNTTLLHLQCKHGVFASKLAHALSIGKCSQEMLNRNIFIAFNIAMLRRFKAFKDVITNGYKLEFSQIKESEEVTITLAVNDGVGSVVLASYTGNASLEYILFYLQNVINAGTNSHNYYAELDGNLLYLYSYEETQEFTYTLDVTFTDGLDDDSWEIVVESIEDITGELLTLWNCITLEDFNKISKCILEEYNVEELFNLQ